MPERIADNFRYCPGCGSPRTDIGSNPLRCTPCGFVWYFNPSCAAGAFLRDSAGRILFIRRAHDPRKGTLAVPGGFIDAGETAEDGLRREIREEVGLEVGPLEFLCSCPNRYHYAGLTYDVCDFLFTAVVDNPNAAKSLDGVAGIEWRTPQSIDESELAFPSIRAGLAKLRERL